MLPNVLQPNETDHVPVLAEEVRELLAIEPGHTVVDATFGAGGHAAVLAADLKGEGRFIAIDRDPTVRPYFEGFKRHAGVQSRFLRGEASVVLDQLAENGVHADAILLDLGVSSMQLDRPERGFSYAVDAPLDMRMDPTAELSAAELVNEASERELATIFRRYGEERYAKQIARAIGAPPQEAADRAHRRARGDHPLRDPRARALRRRAPGEARLPGAAHRRQRRAGRARGGAARRARHAPPRRAARRDRVPLARGPDRQALLPEARAGLRLPAGLPGLRLRARARAAAAEPEGDPPELRTSWPSTPARHRPGCARPRRPSPWRERRQPALCRRRRARRARARPRPPASRRRAAGSPAASSGSASSACSSPASSRSTSPCCRLNMQLDDLGRERTQLRAENAQLSTQIAARAASGRIVAIASDQLGARAGDR